MKQSTSLILAIAAGAAATVAHLDAARAVPNCHQWECGSNTATLRGTKIQGLNVDGLANLDNVRPVPGSVQFPACFFLGSGYSIGVSNGTLIASNPQGYLAPDSCILNSTFQIDAPVQPDRRAPPVMTRITVRIAQRSTVATWFASDALRTTLPTYRFVDAANNTGLCTPARWVDEGPDTGGGSNDQAILVQGETYTDLANVDAARSTSRWFNIACAGSAIAKMRLFGQDPMTTTSSPGMRQATLKMILARYVRSGTKSYTDNGMPLQFVAANGTAFLGAWPADRVGPIEAYWGPDGIICLSHLRIWRHVNENPTVPLGTHEAADRADAVAAGAPGLCTSPTPPAGTVWTTYTVDHDAQ